MQPHHLGLRDPPSIALIMLDPSRDCTMVNTASPKQLETNMIGLQRGKTKEHIHTRDASPAGGFDLDFVLELLELDEDLDLAEGLELDEDFALGMVAG